MNDAAADRLGVLNGLGGLDPPSGLAPGLRGRATQGIVRRGKVLTEATTDDRASSSCGVLPLCAAS
ncbi:hypothetical protein GCM10010187_75180 [Actinomadura coerulea]|nr:hypothetical protein GCM10010187_75180 [Actinomadura coerulea]